MKKQINSVNSWSFKGIITVTILSAMLCTFSAKAYNKPSVALNAVIEDVKSDNGVVNLINCDSETNYNAEQYNAWEFVADELAFETQCWMNSDTEMDNESDLYNADVFVEADMALETESWIISNAETNLEAEPVLQVEYNAKEFVDAELALEAESWMNQSGL